MIWFSASLFVGWAASAHQRARETDDVGTGCPPYLTRETKDVGTGCKRFRRRSLQTTAFGGTALRSALRAQPMKSPAITP